VAAATFAAAGEVPSLLRSGARATLAADLASTNGRGGALTQHALAVVEHNRALEGELAFLAGRCEWSPEPWRQALAAWARTLGAEVFWSYLGERVEERDDPALGDEELEALRSELPAAILGFHGRFAGVYATAGWSHAAIGHLDLLRHAPFSSDLRNRALETAAREVAGALLTPHLHAVDQDILAPEEHLSRRQLAELLEPVLAEVESLLRFLVEDLKLPDELFVSSAFDHLASRLHLALNRKLDYSGDDRERQLVYGLRLRRRLLSLPLSRPTARKLEQELQKDARHLWGDDYGPDLDPTACWFLPGAMADPEASLIMPLYRITDRKVEIDPLQGSAGVRLFWQGRRLLIPRSELASACHQGKAGPAEVSAHLLDTEGQGILGEIRQIEADHAAAQARREASLQSDLQAVELELELALEAHQERARVEAAQGEQELTAVASRLQGQLLEAEQALSKGLAEAVNAGEDRRRRARQHLAMTKASQGGLRGGLARELPVGLALALALGGVIPALGGLGVLEGGSASWPGALLGIVLALLGGRGVRRRRIHRAARAVQAAEGALEADQEMLRARHASQVGSLEAAAEKERAAIRRRLAGLDRAREELRSDSERRRTGLRTAAEEERRRLDREKEASVARLRKKLIARLGVRPEKDKWRFPPLEGAQATGFQPGRRPSSAEMKMTSDEELEARLQLAMLLRR
jgi:hypothetical protein